MLVRNSGPADRTNLSRSGIPDHRTGPKIKSVRNSGPTRTDPDQQNFGPVRASMILIVHFRTNSRTSSTGSFLDTHRNNLSAITFLHKRHGQHVTIFVAENELHQVQMNRHKIDSFSKCNVLLAHL